MTLQQLLYAIETDKYGSFNKAAQVLYVTRQSLTNAINELEKEIGIKIFRRTNKGLLTTVEGREFINMAKSVLYSFDNLKQVYSSKHEKVSRFSMVSIPNFFVEDAFSTLCKEVGESSSIRMTIKTTDAYQSLDDVSSSRAEIATVMIGGSHKAAWVNLLRSKGLEYVKLLESQFELLVSANDPLAQQERISAHMLEGYSFVFWADSSMNILNLIPETSEIAKVIVQNNKYINAQFHTTLFMILENTRAFATSFCGMNRHFSVYPVVSMPIAEDLPFELVYIKQKSRPLSWEAERFIALLQENLKDCHLQSVKS
ncbi:MAG: LysR family transcriptional regulator [Anaerolineae bacterium]|nr:LysR family transcriptional regulator [Anaerolineae bacterium]